MAEAEIKAALIRFNAAIKNSDGPALSGALAQLESLAAKNRAELHPQLVHFLEGRSYAKAAAWLGVSEANAPKPTSPPGGCNASRP